MKFEYETENLILLILNEEDADKVLKFYEEGDAYFGEMEPPKSDTFFTESYQSYSLKCEYNMFLTGKAFRYYIFEKKDRSKVIGTISFRNIAGDYFSCATVGYKMLKDYTGMGYCTESLRCLCDAAFRENNLHRLQAYVQPDNYGSIKVLEKCGFTKEGVVRDYVRLNGKWLDHMLYSRIANYLD